MHGARRIDRIREYVEAFFQHQAAEEADDHLVIADALGTAPFKAAALGIELGAVDAARPDRNVAVHPLIAKHRGSRFRRRDQCVAAQIQPPHDRPHQRLQRLQMIIA